jgi:predicted GTPase
LSEECSSKGALPLSPEVLADRPPFAALLDQCLELFETNNTITAPFRTAITAIRNQLTTGRFYLAVLGQFKRGKSTFLNALLQAEILPTSVVPATAIPTYIEHGDTPRVKVMFTDGSDKIFDKATVEQPGQMRDFLAYYVTEKGNPENRRNVERVSVSFPAEVLQNGVVLIDTPGIGSTHTHNTEATLRFLPRCDAAFIIVSPDPPVTEQELAFFRDISSRIAKIFFILNKKDIVSSTELEELTAFVTHVLHERADFSDDLQVQTVSSREALQTPAAQHVHDDSGFKELFETISRFTSGDKTLVLQCALQRKLRTVLSDVKFNVDLMRSSLSGSVTRIETVLSELERARQEVRDDEARIFDMIAGDHRRLRSFLEEQAKSLREQSREYLVSVIHATPDSKNSLSGSMNGVRNEIAQHVPPFFERKLGEMSALFTRRIDEVLSPYNKRLNALVDSVYKKAADLFGLRFVPDDRTITFEQHRMPYWETHKWSSSLSPVPEGFFDFLLPRFLRTHTIKKRTSRYIDEIILANVENLRYATLLNIDTTIRRFQSNIRQIIDDTVENMTGAIRMALDRHRELSGECGPEIRRLAGLSEQLQTLIDRRL